MNTGGKPLDLNQLQAELAAVGIVVPGLGVFGTEVFTFDEDGAQVDLPPEAQPVVDAHVPAPRAVEFAASRAVDAVAATTDDVPLEIFRFPTQTKHVYDATFSMMAVDRGNGATKRTSAQLVFKRPGATLVQVGTTYVPATFADTAAASWTILPTVDGTDLVISVRGAAGRTVDWLLTGSVGAYAPGGLEA